MGVVDFGEDLFDEPQQAVLVLFVEQEPVLDFGGAARGLEQPDGLVEAAAELLQVFPKLEHVGEKVVEGLVAVEDADGFLQEYATGIVRQCRADGAGGEVF